MGDTNHSTNSILFKTMVGERLQIRFHGALIQAGFPSSAAYQQTALFTQAPDPRHRILAATVDKLNARHGRDKVRLAGAGYDPTWHHKRQWMSPRYTTQWSEILTVR